MTEAQPAFAELHCHSAFSFLDGSTSPETLVTQAKALRLAALALTDHDTLAGAMRFWLAAKQAELKAIIGAEITLAGVQHLTLLAETQRGYANLCKLITRSRLGNHPRSHTEEHGDQFLEIPCLSVDKKSVDEEWPGKVAPVVTWPMLAEHAEGLIALSGCRRGPIAMSLLIGNLDGAQAATKRLLDCFGPRQLYIEVQHHRLREDDGLVRGLAGIARQMQLSVVATGNAHYASRDYARLRDCLIAIDHNLSLTEARKAGLLPANHRYDLAGPQAMAERFAELPQAIHNTLAIAERCSAADSGVSLDWSQHRLPRFVVPEGYSAFSYLYHLCHNALPRRYPQLRPQVLTQLAHELRVIEQAGLADFFLIVWDIVRFARERNIRCSGRGSAANAIVSYLLGISSVDPLAHNLLFERFLSDDKKTMPDIDLDFDHARREEVIQYVYAKYGAAHTAMVANVVTYRARSAIRDLGQALDFPEAVLDRLAKTAESFEPGEAAEVLEQMTTDNRPPTTEEESWSVVGGRSSQTHPLKLLATLMRQIDGLPRHLSIHSGGMLITGMSLDEIVPLEPATMPGRMICQWSKDCVEDAGLIKLDLLSLRTLGMVSEAVTHVEQVTGQPLDLETLPLNDPAVYELLAKADTIACFQVELFSLK